jgi:hypothetical protein
VNLRSEIDHLVVVAASLGEGVAWCRDTLGFEPTAGGTHPLMGTHNRVFRIATPQFPRAYFEIIAIDPAAKAPSHARWFDMDTHQLRAEIANGPRLVHFAVNTNDAAGAATALGGLDIDRGPLIAAERATRSGLLRWKISVRSDGARLFDGALPTLIEWDGSHPTEGLPDSGVTLRGLRITHPEAANLQRAFDAIGLQHVRAVSGPANIVATLQTARSEVHLESGGI